VGDPIRRAGDMRCAAGGLRFGEGNAAKWNFVIGYEELFPQEKFNSVVAKTPSLGL
jgi:hypothetical protein